MKRSGFRIRTNMNSYRIASGLFLHINTSVCMLASAGKIIELNWSVSINFIIELDSQIFSACVIYCFHNLLSFHYLITIRLNLIKFVWIMKNPVNNYRQTQTTVSSPPHHTTRATLAVTINHKMPRKKPKSQLITGKFPYTNPNLILLKE